MATKILVSQPRPQVEKSPYFDLEKKYGIEMVFRPFIKVEPMTPKDFRQQKVSILDHTAIVSLPVMPSTISSTFVRSCA